MDCAHCLRTIDEPDLTDLERIPCPHCGRVTNLLNNGEPRSGERFGNFVLTGDRPLGSGGNGAVWAALDERLNRRVAIKFPLTSRGPEAERLQREAKAAATLKHPHIVPVYHFGEANGRCYIVSELVAGHSLDKELDAHGGHWRSNPRTAARLVAQLAEALAHAHEHGVIHRDVKPSNIMLDQAGEPRLLDFGISRSLDTENRTRTGETPYSPLYLSPEQALGNSAAVTSQTDVYSLGVVLFEMLTGRLPFTDRPKDPTASFDVGALTKNPLELAPSVRRFNRLVPRDLETICARCLEKLPQRRYPGALELGRDLQRFLAGEPIEARPVSVAERFVLWCRRRPLVAGLAAGLLLAVLAGTTVAGNFWFGRQAARQQAAVESTERLRQETLERRARYLADLRLVAELWEQGRLAEIDDKLNAHLPRDDRFPDLRSFEWYLWRNRCRPALATIALSTGEVTAVDWHSSRPWLAAGDQHGRVAIVDLDAGTLVRAWQAHDAAIAGLAWQPGGDGLATVGGEFKLWDATSAKCEFSVPGKFYSLAFEAEGDCVAAGEIGVGFRVWNARTHEALAELPGDGRAVAFSPDGNFLATSFRRRHDLLVNTFSVRLTDWRTGHVLREWDTSKQAEALGFGRHSGQLLFANRLCDIVDGQPKPLFVDSHELVVDALATASDGQTFAVVSGPSRIGLFDWRKQQRRHEFSAGESSIRALRFDATNRRLGAACSDGRIRIWESAAALDGWTLNEAQPQGVHRIAVSPDGTRLVTGSQQSPARLWDTVTGKRIAELGADVGQVYFVEDGRELVAIGRTSLADGSQYRALRWDASDGRLLAEVDTPGKKYIAEYSVAPDGQSLVLLPDNFILTPTTTGLGAFRREPRPPPMIWRWRDAADAPESLDCPRYLLATFSANGRWLAMTGEDDVVRVWDSEQRTLTPMPHLPRNVSKFELDREARIIAATARPLPDIVVFDLASSQRRHTLAGHRGGTYDLVISPDGRRLASHGQDGVIRIWDLESGEQLLTLPGMAGHARQLVGHVLHFAADGEGLIGPTGANAVRRWSAPRAVPESKQISALP